MPWYHGPTLMEHLETVEVDETRLQGSRSAAGAVGEPPNLDFRGFRRHGAGGVIREAGRPGPVLPSGARARWRASSPPTATWTGRRRPVRHADAGRRGRHLARRRDRRRRRAAEVADQFECAPGVDGDERRCCPGRPYLLKIGTAPSPPRSHRAIKYKVNVNTLEHLAAKQLELNEIGVCNLALDRADGLRPYAENRETGGFILIDRLTNNTVGAGMLHFALRRAHNIHWQRLDVDKAARAAEGPEAGVLWFTGLSGAGKSTIANLVEKKLLPWAGTPTCWTATTCATA
jgi:bifunctional enzyme CysN/CysC